MIYALFRSYFVYKRKRKEKKKYFSFVKDLVFSSELLIFMVTS